MRVNEPITERETDVPDGEPLVSRTDPAGRIEFVNHVFVEVSGFTEQELIGSPHNIVRHPHMPEQAFANLWETIKAGRPWDGSGEEPEEIRRLLLGARQRDPGRAGRQGHRLHIDPFQTKPCAGCSGRTDLHGHPQRHGQRHRAVGGRGGAKRRARLLSGLWHAVSGRLLAVTVVAMLAILAVGWLGFSGMASSNDALRHVYERDLVSVNWLRGVLDRIRDNRNHIAQLTIALGRGDPARTGAGRARTSDPGKHGTDCRAVAQL